MVSCFQPYTIPSNSIIGLEVLRRYALMESLSGFVISSAIVSTLKELEAD